MLVLCHLDPSPLICNFSILLAEHSKPSPLILVYEHSFGSYLFDLGFLEQYHLNVV